VGVPKRGISDVDFFLRGGAHEDPQGFSRIIVSLSNLHW